MTRITECRERINRGLTPRLFTYGLNRARRMHGEMNLMTKIRARAVWGRSRYLSVSEGHHNIESSHVFFFGGGGWTHKLGVTGIWRNPHTRALVQHLDKPLFRCSVSGKLESEMFLFHFTKVFEIGLNLSSKWDFYRYFIISHISLKIFVVFNFFVKI